VAIPHAPPAQSVFSGKYKMLFAARCCPRLYQYGVGSVDVTGLVKEFDGMRRELRMLVPAELGVGA
jgi:hypothetical protein